MNFFFAYYGFANEVPYPLEQIFRHLIDFKERAGLPILETSGAGGLAHIKQAVTCVQLV